MTHTCGMTTTRQGKPQKPADEIAERVEGMRRFSVELPTALLEDVDAEARRADRGRQGQIRVLLDAAIRALKEERRAAKKKDAASA